MILGASVRDLGCQNYRRKKDRQKIAPEPKLVVFLRSAVACTVATGLPAMRPPCIFNMQNRAGKVTLAVSLPLKHRTDGSAAQYENVSQPVIEKENAQGQKEKQLPPFYQLVAD